MPNILRIYAGIAQLSTLEMTVAERHVYSSVIKID